MAVQLVARGWTNERIGKELGISAATVRRRLRAASAVLGADSRVTLALRAVEAGLVELTRRDQHQTEGTGHSRTNKTSGGSVTEQEG